MTEVRKPNTAAALEMLKDFQIDTVDYVYHRLYEEDRDRFLIADEVGLGKTLVARGLIARAIDRLWEGENRIDRIDVIYVCSNTDIARQNINRISLDRVDEPGRRQKAFASRLTMLPKHLSDLNENRVNFVSFTPGTSFNLRSSGGIAHERALIYWLLREGWGFGDGAAEKNVFQLGVSTKDRWRNYYLSKAEYADRNQDLKKRFIQKLEERPDLQETFEQLCDDFGYLRRRSAKSQQVKDRQTWFLGEIRRVLANTCCRALEPDLVIMDEFQRFKHLLRDDTEAGALAQKLFGFKHAKTILLSATPYKPYTTNQEVQQAEDHYRDFLDTVDFLFEDESETEALKQDLRAYREALFYRGEEAMTRLREATGRIEGRLRKVMVRTEKLSASPDRNGMLQEEADSTIPIKPRDLHEFAATDAVSRALQTGQPVSYWKSAPYLLNTMQRRGYKFKEKLVEAAEEDAPDLVDALKDRDHHLMSWEKIQSYKPLDPGNARLRKLLECTVEEGFWKLLWIPPSTPYYRPNSGPYRDVDKEAVSKHLIFSQWRIVPKVIAMLCSYKAERRMIDGTDPAHRYSDHSKSRARLLEFSVEDGRWQGMANLTPFYPCFTLANLCNPPAMNADLVGTDSIPSETALRQELREKIKERLAPVLAQHTEREEPDQSWYWAAPALLDLWYNRDEIQRWFETEEEELAWSEMLSLHSEAVNQYSSPVERLKAGFGGELSLGIPPDDLLDVLSKIALGSPAVCALRSLMRPYSQEKVKERPEQFLAGAARIALGFRSLFNLASNTSMLLEMYKDRESRYWETVLDYCVDGNLQAVLDEYTHVLQESLGVADKEPAEAIPQVAEEVRSGASIRTTNLYLDEIRASGNSGTVDLEQHSLRCRFAMRFGDAQAESPYGQEEGKTRKDQVRKAFNSPFQPFIVATTSIGQEGLDFHQYCMNVWHWNLPGNPVDLEQREGRIHRYKGHVIRLNIAERHGLESLEDDLGPLEDIWEKMFDKAREEFKQEYSELAPYWMVPDADHRIIRFVPIYPLSKDKDRYRMLKRTVVTYRLVFGQPRQQDLLNYLHNYYGEELSESKLLECRINLSPDSKD